MLQGKRSGPGETAPGPDLQCALGLPLGRFQAMLLTLFKKVTVLTTLWAPRGVAVGIR